MPPTKSAINDLICRYVLQHNIVDEGDLKGALRLQRELLDTGKDDSLENLLIEQKLIKRSQIKSLRYAILYYFLRKADRFYGKIAVQSNICETAWIDDALKEQKKLNRSKHKLIRLSRILKDKDLINEREDEAIWQAIREIRAQRKKKKKKKLKAKARKAPATKLERQRKPKKEEEIPEGVSDEVIEAMDSKDFNAAPGSGRFARADESDIEEIESDEEIVSEEELEEIMSDAELDSGSSEDEEDDAPAAKAQAKDKDSPDSEEIDSEELDDIDSEELDDIDSEELDDIDSEELDSSEEEVAPASSRSSKKSSGSNVRSRPRSKLRRKLTVKRDDSDEG